MALATIEDCSEEAAALIRARRLKKRAELKVKRKQFGLRGLDGRSVHYTRARAIVAELVRPFGRDITKVQRQSIERAALLCVLSEDLASRRLMGEDIPFDVILRSEGVAKRAVEAIQREQSAIKAATSAPMALTPMTGLR